MRHAARLGLNGFVQNLYNGDVDIEVEGDRQQLEEFLRDVRTGPRSAQVTNVRVEWRETIQHLRSFEIR
jgi:acylphosphatase